MSTLNELIHRLCPEGVEYKKLGEVCELSRGKVYSKTYIIENSGNFPVYSSQTINDGEMGRISTYDYDGEYLTWTTDGAYAGTIFHRRGKFSITNVCGLISIKSSDLLIRFLYYWLSIKTKEHVYKGMGNPKLMSNQMTTILIPIPPLPVQAEIVRILDRFTDLAAELQAELQARREQYEYYRNRLLSFEESQVKWMKMSEVCEFFNGFAFKSNLFKQDGKKIIRITNIAEARLDLTDVKFFIPEDYKINLEQYEIKNGDILIAMSGATTGKIGYYEGDEILYMNQRVGKIAPIKSILNNRFLFHFLLSKTKYIYQLAGGGAQPNLSSTKFLNTLIIPLPTKEEQIKIATILDRFEALTADLSEGLPAEIAAVQEQYEYYRNKLLSFPGNEKISA